jgi:hypothetical protein
VGLEYKNHFQVWNIWFCNKWVKKILTLYPFSESMKVTGIYQWWTRWKWCKMLIHVSVVSNVSVKDLEVWFIMYLFLIVMANALDWLVINHQFCISWIITLFLFGEFNFKVGQLVVWSFTRELSVMVMLWENYYFSIQWNFITFCQFLCSQGIL